MWNRVRECTCFLQNWSTLSWHSSKDAWQPIGLSWFLVSNQWSFHKVCFADVWMNFSACSISSIWQHAAAAEREHLWFGPLWFISCCGTNVVIVSPWQNNEWMMNWWQEEDEAKELFCCHCHSWPTWVEPAKLFFSKVEQSKTFSLLWQVWSSSRKCPLQFLILFWIAILLPKFWLNMMNSSRLNEQTNQQTQC